MTFGDKIAVISARQIKIGRERFELSISNVITAAFARKIFAIFGKYVKNVIFQIKETTKR